MDAPQAARQEVLAFRWARQGLNERAPREGLVAVAACGIQNTPPGSALLALGARLSGLSPDDLSRALDVDKSLIQLWSLRAAPYVVPTPEAATFTAGLLPDDEASTLYLMRGAVDHLCLFEMMASEAVDLTAATLVDVLGGGAALTKDELGVALAAEIGEWLPLRRLRLWQALDGIGDNTYGQSLVRYALSVVSLRGLICLASTSATGAVRLMLVREWLGKPLAQTAPAAARAELVRHFLRHLGPGDVSGFAKWAGVSPDYARASWALVADELAAVSFGKRTLYLLATDAEALKQAELPTGVRLLPPHDPYLSAHDKPLLVPDKALHSLIWRTVGNPGAVAIDGEIAAVWHPQTRAGTLTLRIEPFRDLSAGERRLIECDAEAMAALRGVGTVVVRYGE